MKKTSPSRTKVVVVGGGFAGAYCTQYLDRKLDPHRFEVTLIDQNNYFVFYPLLVEAGTGSLEPRHTIVSIRSFISRHQFLMAKVDSIDFTKKSVTCYIESTERSIQLNYDYLVLAPGTVTRLPNIPGLARHAFTMKSLADAIAIRDHTIRMLEAADATVDVEERRRLLQLVVVGANFTGAEVAGEFHRFLHEAKRRYPNIDKSDLRVTLVELSPRILSAVDDDLSDYATRQLERRGIRILTNTSVSEVTKGQVTLSNGELLPTETLIWCAGIQPSPLIAKLKGIPVDERGYIETDLNMQVPGLEHVWSIGDAAVNRSAEGHVYPPTAQHAVQLGRSLGRHLEAKLLGRQTKPFRIRNRGTLAALGCRTAVAKVFGVKLSGFAAWFLWRTVYLLKMPGFARKLRVAFDWTADLVAKPEVVQLGTALRKSNLELTKGDDAP